MSQVASPYLPGADVVLSKIVLIISFPSRTASGKRGSKCCWISSNLSLYESKLPKDTQSDQAWETFRDQPEIATRAESDERAKKTLNKYRVIKESLTRAANVNSRSSDRNVLSSMAVSITSLSNSSLRNRYSVTPSHIRKSFYC